MAREIDAIDLARQEHALGSLTALARCYRLCHRARLTWPRCTFSAHASKRQPVSLPAAARAYEEVLRIDPTHGPALSELIFARKQLADWSDLAAMQTRFRGAVGARQPYLAPFSQLSDVDPCRATTLR
jgi:hypothetical protein